MKKILICLILFLLTAFPVQAHPRTELPQISVQAMDTLDSRTATPGTLVHFKLCEKLVLSPADELNAGTILTGRLVQVKKGSGWGCPGKMRIRIELPAEAKKQGEVFLRGTAPNFFVQVSLLGGLVKGKNAVCTSGSRYLLKISDLPDKK